MAAICHCHTAQQLEAGQLRSSLSPSEWHSKCKGAIRTNRGLVLCDCPCHCGPPVCLRCGYPAERWECDNQLECADRVEERLQHHELCQQIRSAKRRSRPDDLAPTPVLKIVRPTIGRCQHCGAPTKGGRFIPGHDAKLKGELAREGTLASQAELHARGWKLSQNHSVIAMAQDPGFLERRTHQRWETYEQ